MVSPLHRVPSPFSQLLLAEADEFGEHDAVLHWTKEELEANLKTDDDPVDDNNNSKARLVDEILQTIETFETLSDVELSEADLLSGSLWMDGKLFVEEHHFGDQRHSQIPSLNELGVVYDTINNGAFTPPQTPPYEQLQSAATPPYEMSPAVGAVANCINNTNHQSDLAYLVIPMDIPVYAPTSQQTDVDRELAVVDELVRTCASNFLPASPSSSSISGSCSASDSSSEDFEWSGGDSGKSAKATVNRRRAKPYSINDDKRSRKKEQNKNAATRYRMKKKAEVAEIQSEENTLEQAKVGLESKIVDLEREIKCLKGLMKDFFKEKGLIR